MEKVILIGLFALLPQITSAQFNKIICDDRSRLEKQLKSYQGAERQGRGLSGSDALTEIWVERDSGNWTIVQNYANGTSCVVAMGEYWENQSSAEDPA